ncbi:uncharacterized protein [Solanum lycopersicum]|uniref:uncharacterized protein n=1 Tax=Solanum lycopersicum TaxID=4081 RepID=UPI000532FA4E|nr:uncharacterized protein LOC104645981 [Solanum lycopersicum]
MKTRNAGRRVGETTDGGNQAPPQALVVGVQVFVNPTALTDGEVRATLEKAELAAYQLKDVAQVWYMMWVDRRAPRDAPITRDILITSFLESFSLVSSNRDEMSRFVTGVSKDLVEECRAAMLHDNVDFTRLMVHSQPKFKKGHRHLGNPTPSSNTNDKWGKYAPKKGNDRNSQRDRKLCGKWGRFHGGECMVGSNACYRCGKSGHMIRDCPYVKNLAKKDTQPRPNPIPAVEPRKRNTIYVLKGREEQEKSTDVLTSNLHVFSFLVYALLDPGSTLSSVTPLLATKYELLPKILHDPFLS